LGTESWRDHDAAIDRLAGRAVPRRARGG
jgi:hypothetical protein